MRCVAVATDAHGQRPLMTLDLQRYDLCSPLPLSELRGEVMRTPQHIDEIGIARHNFAFGRLGDCPARSRHRSLESVGAGQRRVDAGGIGIFKLTALAVRGPRSLRVTLSNTTVQVCQAAGNSAPIMAALRTEQLTVPAELGLGLPRFRHPKHVRRTGPADSEALAELCKRTFTCSTVGCGKRVRAGQGA